MRTRPAERENDSALSPSTFRKFGWPLEKRGEEDRALQFYLRCFMDVFSQLSRS